MNWASMCTAWTVTEMRLYLSVQNPLYFHGHNSVSSGRQNNNLNSRLRRFPALILLVILPTSSQISVLLPLVPPFANAYHVAIIRRLARFFCPMWFSSHASSSHCPFPLFVTAPCITIVSVSLLFFLVSLLLLGIYHYSDHVVCIEHFYSIPFQILKVAMMLH